MVNSIVEAVYKHALEQPQRPAISFASRAVAVKGERQPDSVTTGTVDTTGAANEAQTLAWQHISYGQLYADIERLARALRAWGVHRGDRVALFLSNCPEFITVYLSIQLAGGIVVLVNTQYRQVELSHIMTDAGVRLCVTSSAGATELQRLSLPDLEALIVVDAPSGAAASQPFPSLALVDFIEPFSRPAVSGVEQARSGNVTGASTAGDTLPALTLPQADDPALIGYTSGTTGRSKGALLRHSNLVSNIIAVTTAWHWTVAIVCY